MRSILTGRGQVSLGRLANRFGSCIGTNTKPLHRVISPPSTPNHYSICPSVSLADTLEREPEHISRTDRISARQQKSAAANGVSKSSSGFQLQALWFESNQKAFCDPHRKSQSGQQTEQGHVHINAIGQVSGHHQLHQPLDQLWQMGENVQCPALQSEVPLWVFWHSRKVGLPRAAAARRVDLQAEKFDDSHQKSTGIAANLLGKRDTKFCGLVALSQQSGFGAFPWSFGDNARFLHGAGNRSLQRRGFAAGVSSCMPQGR